MYDYLSIINLAVTFATIIGGALAFRVGFTRTANEVQERVISALDSEVRALNKQLETLSERLNEIEKENARLKLVINAISSAMSRRKIKIDVQQDMINISDESGRIEPVRIQESGVR